MIILDNDKELSEIILLLRQEEAEELIEALKTLILSPVNRDHIHIDDKDYKHEITISIYNHEDSLSAYSTDIQEIIKANM